MSTPRYLHPSLTQLSVDAIARIDAACDAFERAWKQRTSIEQLPPELEGVLADFQGAEREQLLQELQAIDLNYRHRWGEADGKQELQPYQHVDRFQLRSPLGSGAFGIVWLARDTHLVRLVALKLPRTDQVGTRQAHQFLREARAAGQLQHPNIVRIHEVGQTADTVYIVSEWIRGQSLDIVLKDRQFSFTESATIIAAIAHALDHAHRHGVIHRDLKPSNIMLDEQDLPVVMDFGLAKRTSGELTWTVDGQLLGTPAYMSPEQASGQSHHVDGRTDIYSLGVVLFEMITGVLPFEGDTRTLLYRVIHHAPPAAFRLRPGLPRDLNTICMKCLSKCPADRYATAADVARDLESYLRGESIVARPLPIAVRCVRSCQRRPWAAVALGLLTILLGSIPYAAGLYDKLAQRIVVLTRHTDQQSEQLKLQGAGSKWQWRPAPTANQFLVELAWEHFRHTVPTLRDAYREDDATVAEGGLSLLAAHAADPTLAIPQLENAIQRTARALERQPNREDFWELRFRCEFLLLHLYLRTGEHAHASELHALIQHQLDNPLVNDLTDYPAWQKKVTLFDMYLSGTNDLSALRTLSTTTNADIDAAPVTNDPGVDDTLAAIVAQMMQLPSSSAMTRQLELLELYRDLVRHLRHHSQLDLATIQALQRELIWPTHPQDIYALACILDEERERHVGENSPE